MPPRRPCQVYDELKGRLGGDRSLRKGRGLTLVEAAPEPAGGGGAGRRALAAALLHAPGPGCWPGCARVVRCWPRSSRCCAASTAHRRLPPRATPPPAPAGGWFSGLFGGGRGREQSTAAAAAPAVQGLYMYGGVGVGKTMLMDLLAQAAPPYFQVRPGGAPPFVSVYLFNPGPRRRPFRLARRPAAGASGCWLAVAPARLKCAYPRGCRLRPPQHSTPSGCAAPLAAAAGAHPLPRLHD